jgi:hypothetical protein
MINPTRPNPVLCSGMRVRPIAHGGDRIGRFGEGQQAPRQLLGLRRVVACAHGDEHVTPVETVGFGCFPIALQAVTGSPGT